MDNGTGWSMKDNFYIEGCGWEAELLPGLLYRPSALPCWFNRFMQRVFFGVKWRKIGGDE